jgi:rhodanese-related sulfurtransferase
MKNKVHLVISVSAFVWCLLVVAPAKSGENHSVGLETSRQHHRVLAIDDTADKGMVVGIDAGHLFRLMEMDPNVYVLYIGSGSDFKHWFGGSKNAVHITLNQVKENTLKLPKDKTLILICPSGQQSPVAAKKLSARGYVVYYVVGSIQALIKFEKNKPKPMKEKPDQENRGKNIRQQQKNDEPHYPESIFEEEDMGC